MRNVLASCCFLVYEWSNNRKMFPYFWWHSNSCPGVTSFLGYFFASFSDRGEKQQVWKQPDLHLFLHRGYETNGTIQYTPSAQAPLQPPTPACRRDLDLSGKNAGPSKWQKISQRTTDK